MEPGQRLAQRYLLQKVLGQGGMGEVFQAWDERSNRPVAIKSSDLTQWGPLHRQASLFRFRREAELLLRLTHPNLPLFFDFIEEDEQAYLVMELIQGCNLAQWVKAQGPLADAELTQIASTLLEVLEFLHSCQPPVIFRDLKPSNIMRTPAGDYKLVDFGLARAPIDGLGESESALTQSSNMVSPGFAAPEQYSGTCDGRSDLYSLGATLYFLATAQVPLDAVQRASSGQNLPQLDDLNPEISTPMALLVQQLLQLTRERRPTSAQAARALLGGTTFEVATIMSPATPRVAGSPRRAMMWLKAASLLAGLHLISNWPLPQTEVDITTSPSGAEVWSGESKLGTTPCRVQAQQFTVLTLKRAGHFPTQDQPAKFTFSGPLALFVQLRPGSMETSLDWDFLPGYYPPGVGGPPPLMKPALNLALQGHSMALPPEWAIVSRSPRSLSLRKLQSSLGSSRVASLETLAILQPAQRMQSNLDQLEPGWLLARQLTSQESSVVYLERVAGAMAGRQAWVYVRKAHLGLELRLRAEPAESVYDFVKDVEALRACLDLDL